jgi:hypothetical protein
VDAEVAVPQDLQGVEVDPAVVGERVDGGDPLGQVGRPARQVEGRAYGCRDRRRAAPVGLVDLQALAVHPQSRTGVVVRQEHVDGGIRRPARRTPQLGCGVPRDDATALDEPDGSAPPSVP